MTIKSIIKLVTPPLLLELGKSLRGRWRRRGVEWEYVPAGWRGTLTKPEARGWNVRSVLDTYKRKWPAFVQRLQGPGPFAASPESPSSEQTDLVFHNSMMVYAYALALAARCKRRIAMLDWGGGIGHYYLMSTTLVPDLEIEYHCRDLPILAQHGQSLFPQAHFYSDDACLTRSYDFVLASASLHYMEDWLGLLKQLQRVTAGYLLVTRLPVVVACPSFVFVQRPYQYGYDTEYLGWCLSRSEFLNAAVENDLVLVREFITGERPTIHRAPGQCEYRGFLFRAR